MPTPTLINNHFLDRTTGLVHIGETNERDNKSEWPWFTCGWGFAMSSVTSLPVSCMGCAAGVTMHDWTKDPTT